MSEPLIVAVPSKGRLQENTTAFFARAGFSLVQGGEREYRGRLAGVSDVEIAFLSASEIARELAAGGAHFGVTGLDLIHETVPDPVARDRAFHLVTPLGFGFADVVVAVPKAWIDVRTMADLDAVAHDFRVRHGRRLRVATKYVHLTRAFFATHGVADYRIVESLGATEGAPAAGSAELIVDITTTGATLSANALKILDDGVILRSQAHLVAGRTAGWSEHAVSAAVTILDRVAAEARARAVKEMRLVVPDPASFAAVAATRFGAVAPFGTDMKPLTLHCPVKQAAACAALARAHGAETVTLATLSDVFEARNPMVDALKAAIA